MDHVKGMLAVMREQSIKSGVDSPPIPTRDLARVVRAAQLAGVGLSVANHSHVHRAYCEYLIVYAPADSECALVVARFESGTFDEIERQFDQRESDYELGSRARYVIY